MLETFVYRELRRQASWDADPVRFHHFRDRDGAEVDVVLETCRLVESRKSGRVRTYRLAPRALESAEDWLARQRSLWEGRLDRLDEHLARVKKERRP